MSESPTPPEELEGERSSRDAGYWAKGRNVLRVSDVPAGAVNPEEVVTVWKQEFPDFHPPQSRFYRSGSATSGTTRVSGQCSTPWPPRADAFVT